WPASPSGARERAARRILLNGDVPVVRHGGRALNSWTLVARSSSASSLPLGGQAPLTPVRIAPGYDPPGPWRAPRSATTLARVCDLKARGLSTARVASILNTEGPPVPRWPVARHHACPRPPEGRLGGPAGRRRR